MQPLLPWPVLASALAVSIPVSLGTAALLATRGSRWRIAMLASGASVAAALAVGATVLVGRAWGSPAVPPPVIRPDLLTATMLVLVTCLGYAVLRFSRSYLANDPGEARYVRWLTTTLAAVAVLVSTSSLLVIACAWTATSLALHQLLTFYHDRKLAQVAAHKKFLVSRMADACLLVALGILHHEVGSLDLDAIEHWVGARTTLPVSVHLAACLVALAAMLKSAQLPFHGWLVQVMEAPTPVSALLHAGVVNIGGFVLVRLAPLMRLATGAQLLLVIVGTFTAVIASLVATTRVSIKVALAWSTCAQMGFMMIECGLGAWHLALVHLLAHSVYKAHAFLDSGGTVTAWLRLVRAPGRRPLPVLHVALSLVVLSGVLLTIAWCAERSGVASGTGHRFLLLGTILPLACAPLLARSAAGGVRSVALTFLTCVAVFALYALWHVLSPALFAELPDSSPLAARWLVVLPALVVLFAIQTGLEARPSGRFAGIMHAWLFAGLYLDETFTRLTFRVWPPRRRRPDANAPPSGMRNPAGSVT